MASCCLCKWGNIDRRIKLWQHVYESDGAEKLSSKTVKLYEIVTILSVLCCGSLIGFSESKNEHDSVVFAHDVIRAYGIVMSTLGGITSITICSITTGCSLKNTFEFVQTAIIFSNVSLFSIILSLICLLITTCLHFQMYISFAITPFVLGVIAFSFHMYGTLHKRIYELMFRDDLDRPLTPLLNSGEKSQDNDENTSAIVSAEGSLDSELEQRYNNTV
jgi:hypothetical protein